MELLLGAEALAGVTGVMVSTQLDVTSQQHLFLLGQNGANFLTVMHQTHTQIILPDLSAPQHTPSLLIQGTADGVCVARQQLMVCVCLCRAQFGDIMVTRSEIQCCFSVKILQ